MANPDVLTTVDTAFASVWSDIQAKQDSYFAANQIYFQGLWTHSNLPADGNAVDPDLLGSHPTNQSATWNDFGSATMNLAAMKCDQYLGPDGAGYVASLALMVGSDFWIKSINNGPEDERSIDWAIMDLPKRWNS